MPKPLFVEKTIEINAPASRVWDAITKREYTDVWVEEFEKNDSDLDSKFHIESDWKLGSSVLWKQEDGRAVVEGKVTALEPERLLSFTVIDTRGGYRPAPSAEDGVTFRLEDHNETCVLHLKQGDFSFLTDGGAYHRASSAIWDRVLPKIKYLAEQQL